LSKISSVTVSDRELSLDTKKIKKVNDILAQYYKTAKPLVKRMEAGFSIEIPKISSLPLISQ
jgi:transcriptional regulatory protein LevR